LCSSSTSSPGSSTTRARPSTLSRRLAGQHGKELAPALEASLRTAGFSKAEAAELHDQLSNLVFALVPPELRGRRNRAAFERGLELLHAGLEARLRQQ
jgi:hypothetical protein